MTSAPVAFNSANDWQLRAEAVKFYLGQFLLGRWRFDAYHHDGHPFSGPAKEMDLVALPASVPCPSSWPLHIIDLPLGVGSRRFFLTACGFGYIRKRYPLYFVSLQGNFAEYTGTWSKKAHGNIGRSLKKLRVQCGGDLGFEEFKAPDEMRVFLADAVPVAVKTYQARLFDSALPTSSSFEERLVREAKQDGVRAYLLRHGRKAIAYAYCTIDAKRERLTYQVVGYDQTYKAFSPGTVLLYLILQKQFAHPDALYFDFGAGGMGFYKRFFSTGSVDCAEVYYFPLRIKPILMIGLLEALDATSGLITRIAERLGFKEKLKKLLRRGLQAG